METGTLIVQSLTPWLGITAIAALVFGLNRMAAFLAVCFVTGVLLIPLLTPILNQLPAWSLVFGLVLLLLIVLHRLISFVFGEQTAAFFTGTWLVRIFDFLLLGPFRILKTIFIYLKGF